jgi:hypothetical protein
MQILEVMLGPKTVFERNGLTTKLIEFIRKRGKALSKDDWT